METQKNFPIEEIKNGGQFVLVKYINENDYKTKNYVLVQNCDLVAVTFGDLVAVSYTPQDEKDKMLPAKTAQVIAMFNDKTNDFMVNLTNRDYVDTLEELDVVYNAEKILANITDPSAPKGAGTGGGFVGASDGDESVTSPMEKGGEDNGGNGGSHGGGIKIIIKMPKEEEEKKEHTQGSGIFGTDSDEEMDEMNKAIKTLEGDDSKEKLKFVKKGKYIQFKGK